MPTSPPYICSLCALARLPGTPIPCDDAHWLIAKGFARPFGSSLDNAVVRLAATLAGLNWLRVVGYELGGPLESRSDRGIPDSVRISDEDEG